MTVYDANNKLIDYFKTHDSFRVWEDYKELVIVSDDLFSIHAALRGSLNYLVDIKLLNKSRNDDDAFDVYVLNRPLIMQTQVCNIEFATVLRFIRTLQDWRDVSGAMVQIDPFNITQDNLLTVLGLADKAIEKMKEEEA